MGRRIAPLPDSRECGCSVRCNDPAVPAMVEHISEPRGKVERHRRAHSPWQPHDPARGDRVHGFVPAFREGQPYHGPASLRGRWLRASRPGFDLGGRLTHPEGPLTERRYLLPFILVT